MAAEKRKESLPLESTFTANISVFSGMQSFLGVLWKQSGTFGVPPVLTTYMTQKNFALKFHNILKKSVPRPSRRVSPPHSPAARRF